MSLSGIVAVARNGVIGIKNRLPVRLPADLRRFRIMTTNKPIIMGRKTHESIGRSLPNRTNIVLSQNPAYKGFTGSIAVNKFTDAYDVAARTGAKNAFVIGGGQIFNFFLPVINKLYLTVIDADLQGDTYFPIPVDVMLKWEGKLVQSFAEGATNRYKQTFHIIQMPEIEELACYMEHPIFEGT